MSKIYAFYNPLAGNGGCREDVKLLELVYDDEIIYCDMTQPETYETQLFALQPEDFLILCGGDGTVNRFLNLVQDTPIACDILLFPLGIRNNLACCMGHRFGDVPFSVKQQLIRCPSVTVGNRTLRFVWGVEFEPCGSHCRACVNTGDTSHRFRQLQLTVSRHGEPALLLQGRKACRRTAKNISTARQYAFHFDKPVTVRVDGETIGAAESCATAIEVR